MRKFFLILCLMLCCSTAYAATMGESNALKMAQLYNTTMPMSAKGMVTQLQFDGFSENEANYAIKNGTFNWTDNALKAAKNYLQIMPMSKKALHDQLIFDGFTPEQANAGVNGAYQ